MWSETESAFEMMRSLRGALETKIVESEDYRALAALNAAIREAERLNRSLAVAMEDRASAPIAVEHPPEPVGSPDEAAEGTRPEDLEERINNLFALAEAAAVRPWWKRLVG